MKELGYVPEPEQYASAGDLLFIENSVEARTFFEESYGKGGYVFLCNATLSSLRYPSLPFWVYLDAKNKKIISMIPAFIMDNFEDILDLEFRELKPFTSDAFIFWKNTLLAVVITSTGEMVIQRVRTILTEEDMLSISRLENAYKVNDVYPVELYSVDDHKFVCVCWSVEAEDYDGVIWHPVCQDDIVLAKQAEGNVLTEYPIELGDTAVIGGEIYTLCYRKDLGKYFQRNAVQTKLSVNQSQSQEKQVIPPPEPVEKPTQVFSMPKPHQAKPQPKKAASGRCVCMNLNGVKNDEPMASAKTQPHIIPFKPKK